MDLSYSDEEIAKCTEQASTERIAGQPHGNWIFKLSEQIAVKCGHGVTAIEADNQRMAFELLDSTIVRVPRVHRYFMYGEIGYLVMDYVDGKQIDTLSEDHYAKLTAVLSHFREIKNDVPGNLSGRESPLGRPFPDNDKVPRFATKIEMQQWFNSRLLRHQRQISTLCFEKSDLIFTHRDLAPRNILWSDDGTLTLVDWMSAGFYPAEFELCNPRESCDEVFSQRLEQILETMSHVDQTMIDVLMQTYFNSFRYRL